MTPLTQSSKRLKIAQEHSPGTSDPAIVRLRRSAFLASLSRPISPPPNSTLPQTPSLNHEQNLENEALSVTQSTTLTETFIKSELAVGSSGKSDNDVESALSLSGGAETGSIGFYLGRPAQAIQSNHPPLFISSPFRLTHIRDLPSNLNRDAIGIKDMLGSPIIREVWIFNFCFDIDWIMAQFDSDIRHLVSVKVVHGSWKQEDRNKIAIDEACQRWPNVKAIQAYLPDPFGTHHSKMIVLFRHDDLAQIIIHTANMLECDWTNATQAAWLSPLLPLRLKNVDSTSRAAMTSPELGAIGYGKRFQHDLCTYLKAYGKNKLSILVEELQKYDFDAVRGALIASVPSKIKNAFRDYDKIDVWGRVALWRALRNISKLNSPSALSDRKAHVVSQVSSIATLKAGWIEESLFHIIGSKTTKKFSIIYPTPRDVGQSVSGYAFGGSIHTKVVSAQHQKQVVALRPYLCRWTRSETRNAQRSGRDLVAPHIKTYIRFSSTPTTEDPAPYIDWALLTSANLSVQAWGSDGKKGKGKATLEEGEVQVQSYELGVLVWPELFASDEQQRGISVEKRASMVPIFGKDTPDLDNLVNMEDEAEVVVGLRMPYDLPLTPYSDTDMPWSPNVEHKDPDKFGRTWPPDHTW